MDKSMISDLVAVTEKLAVEGSNKKIIEQISKIVEPQWKFHMDDIYGDRGGNPYPQIEELDVLHFKVEKCRFMPSKNSQEELVNKIKELNISQISDVEIVKYHYVGHFIVVTLNKN